MAIVAFNPNTGARLSTGQTVTFQGRTYTQGSTAIGGTTAPAPAPAPRPVVKAVATAPTAPAKVVSGGSNPRGLTTTQVKAIQTQAGIKVDGIIGAQTQAVFNRTAPAPAPVTAPVITPAPTLTPTPPPIDAPIDAPIPAPAPTITPLQPPTSETVGGGINLVSGGNLQLGTNSEQVRQLQTMLGITADGIFGTQTQAAVKAYQTANNLTADGIVGSKTNAALLKGTPAKTVSNVIATGSLTPETKTVIPPLVPGADNATPFVAGITAAQDEANKTAQAKQKQVQDDYSSMSKTISGLLETSGGQGQATLDAEAAAGIAEKQAAVDEVNSQIQTKLAEFRSFSVDQEGKAITMASIQGSILQKKNEVAADIGMLQAQADAMQGKLTRAQDAVNRAIDLKYADIKTQLDIRIAQLGLLKDTLTAKEKVTADLLDKQYKAQTLALSTQIANEKDKNATLLNQMQTYPDAGITFKDTIESANTKITSRSKIYADKIRPPVGGSFTGYTGSEINSIKDNINKVGLDATIAGISNPKEVEEIIKISKETKDTEQFLTKDYFTKMYTEEKLRASAKELGFTAGGFLGIGVGAKGISDYLDYLVKLVEQYRQAGFTDKEILSKMS